MGPQDKPSFVDSLQREKCNLTLNMYMKLESSFLARAWELVTESDEATGCNWKHRQLGDRWVTQQQSCAP